VLNLLQVNGPITSRSAVQDILATEGVINPEYKVIHDLGLILGGTEDQSLHHDIARQTTLSEVNPNVEGWEVARLEYNEAMASAWAPRSVLVSLGGSDTVQIGVQKDQVRFG